jgi:hypothetical protein
MTRIAVITKSFAPDFELCAALNRSVLDFAPETTQHHIIVPRSDLNLFDQLSGPRPGFGGRSGADCGFRR